MALPILVASAFALRVQLYVETGLSWRYQSTWCKLIKLAFWNGLDATGLSYAFGPEVLLANALCARPDGAFRRALMHYVMRSAGDLEQAFPPGSLDRLPRAVSAHLRGCPSCFERGFHSALFQVRVLARCPMHVELLIEGCPQCAFTEPYAISPELRRTGHVCGGCGCRILQIGHVDAERQVLFRPWLQRLSAWRRWIDQQLSGLPAATGHFSGQRVLIALRQLGAIRQWSLRYAVAPPLLATPRHHDTLVLTTAYSDSIFTEADLYRVASEHYYCARRRLRRRLRTRERRAVDAVISERPSRLAWVDLSGHASSLVLWRVAWEKPHAAPASFQPYSERNHTPTNVMLWLATRPLSFDIETISSSIERLDREFADSYQRCRALAKWMQSRGDPMLSLNALRLPLPRHCLRWDA